MSTQYRLVQSGKTASGGCSAGQGSSEPVAPRIYFIYLFIIFMLTTAETVTDSSTFQNVE
jgi:carbohydrate-binding DOMON domain-containing protein